MRRQASAGGSSAGAGCTMRLDPFELPVRYSANLAGAAQEQVSILLDRKTAVLKHRLAGGLPATTSVPLAAYRGVAVRMVALDAEDRLLATIELMHPDPSLSLPLMVADSIDDIAADWQSWGRILGLPLLLIEADGSVTEPMPQIGQVALGTPATRRRPAFTAKRRPRFLTRRKAGRARAAERLEGREIIARN